MVKAAPNREDQDGGYNLYIIQYHRLLLPLVGFGFGLDFFRSVFPELAMGLSLLVGMNIDYIS